MAKKYDFNKEFSKGSAAKEKIGAAAIWSIYPCPRWGANSGIKEIRYRDFWTDDPDLSEVVVPVTGNRTWLDVYRAADIAISLSGDNHHIYIERFSPTEIRGMFELRTGS